MQQKHPDLKPHNVLAVLTPFEPCETPRKCCVQMSWWYNFAAFLPIPVLGNEAIGYCTVVVVVHVEDPTKPLVLIDTG